MIVAILKSLVRRRAQGAFEQLRALHAPAHRPFVATGVRAECEPLVGSRASVIVAKVFCEASRTRQRCLSMCRR